MSPQGGGALTWASRAEAQVSSRSWTCRLPPRRAALPHWAGGGRRLCPAAGRLWREVWQEHRRPRDPATVHGQGAPGRGATTSPRAPGAAARGSRREWFPRPALSPPPFPFSRLPSLLPGVGGTSPASSSLQSGGEERPPALSCLPANFSGTRVSNSPPRPQLGGCSRTSSGRAARSQRLEGRRRAPGRHSGPPGRAAPRAAASPFFAARPSVRPASRSPRCSPAGRAPPALSAPPPPGLFLCVGCGLAPRAGGGWTDRRAPAPPRPCPSTRGPWSPREHKARAAGAADAPLFPLAGAGQLARPGLPAARSSRRPVALRQGHLRRAREPGGCPGRAPSRRRLGALRRLPRLDHRRVKIREWRRLGERNRARRRSRKLSCSSPPGGSGPALQGPRAEPQAARARSGSQ